MYGLSECLSLNFFMGKHPSLTANHKLNLSTICLFPSDGVN